VDFREYFFGMFGFLRKFGTQMMIAGLLLHKKKKKTAREARPLRDTARAMRRIYRA